MHLKKNVSNSKKINGYLPLSTIYETMERWKKMRIAGGGTIRRSTIKINSDTIRNRNFYTNVDFYHFQMPLG